MNIPNSVSPEGISLIKRFEGCHKVNSDGDYRSYRCVSGKWTIGYGHTQAVRSGMTATPEMCEAYLQEDMRKVCAHVKQIVSVPLSQPQLDALASFVFSIGLPAFKKSTVIKKLNLGQYHSVPSEMAKWNSAKVDGVITALSGLTRRRAAESALWTLDGELGETDAVMPQRPEIAPLAALKHSKTIWGASFATAGVLCAEAVEQLHSLASYSSAVGYICVAVTLCGLGVVAYSRVKDNKEGIH